MAETRKYEFVWSNYQSLLTIESNLETLRVFRDDPWNQLDYTFEVANENVIRCFYGTSDLKEDEKRGEMFLDDMYFSEYKRRVESERMKSWDCFEELRHTDFSMQTDKQILEMLRKNILQWQRQITLFRATQATPQEPLFRELQKYIRGDSIKYLHSAVPDLTVRERASWKIDILSRPYDEDRILEHLYRYPWLVAQTYTMRDALEIMRHRYEDGMKRDWSDDTSVVPHDNLDAELVPEARNIVEKLCWLGWSRLEVKERWAGMDFYLIPLMEEIANRGNEDIHDLQKLYLSFEIESLLRGDRISLEEKERRKKCFVGVFDHGDIRYISGDEAVALATEELGDLYRVEDASEVGGAVANKGYARGVVRILGANDAVRVRQLREDFLQGEILVTQMTQPNIMDIAMLAGAIVTDEGGLLSHAAVISREFHIPCIVGTKIATQVLHNGDLVEVDAERGMVTILKKKGE